MAAGKPNGASIQKIAMRKDLGLAATGFGKVFNQQK